MCIHINTSKLVYAYLYTHVTPIIIPLHVLHCAHCNTTCTVYIHLYQRALNIYMLVC